MAKLAFQPTLATVARITLAVTHSMVWGGVLVYGGHALAAVPAKPADIAQTSQTIQSSKQNALQAATQTATASATAAASSSAPPSISSDFTCPDLRKAVSKLPIYLSNITNAKTTRTADGGPYKRLDLKCQEFICETVPQNDFSNVYMPGHPDANSAGYVKFPRINIASEFAGLTNSAEELKLLASKQLCGSHAIVSSTSALIKYDPGTSVQSDTFTFTVDGKLSTWARTLRDGTLNQYAFNADGTLTDSGALRAAQPGAGSSSAANANVNGQPASGAASSSNVNAQPSSSSTTY